LDNGHNTEAQRSEAETRQKAFCEGLGIQYDRIVWDEVFYALNGSLREENPQALPSDYCMPLRREDVFDLSLVSSQTLRISAEDLPRLEAYRTNRHELINGLVSSGHLPPEDLEAFEHADQRSNETQLNEGGSITFKPLYGEISFISHLSEGYRPVTDYYFGRDSSGSMVSPGSVVSTSAKYADYLKQMHPEQKFHQKDGICIAALRRHEEEFLKLAITFDSVSAAVGPRLAQRADLDSNGRLTPAARAAGKLVFYAPPLRLNSQNKDNFYFDGSTGTCHLRDAMPICSMQDLIKRYQVPPAGLTPLTSFALAVKGEMARTRAEYPYARIAVAFSSDGAETGVLPGTDIKRQRHEIMDTLMEMVLSGQRLSLHPITGDDGAGIPMNVNLGQAMHQMLADKQAESKRVRRDKHTWFTQRRGGFSGAAAAQRLGDHAGWMSIIDEFTPNAMGDACDDGFTEGIQAALKVILDRPLLTKTDCEKANDYFSRLQAIAQKADAITKTGASKLQAQLANRKSGISTNSIGKEWLANMQKFNALVREIASENAQHGAFDTTSAPTGRRTGIAVLGTFGGRRDRTPAAINTLGTGFQIAKATVVTPRFDYAEDIHMTDLARQLENWKQEMGGYFPPLDNPPAYTDR
jgi:hypothetical protein